MTLLSIETSTQVCSAALSIDDKVIDHRINIEGSNHAALLPVYIEDLLQKAREKELKIDAVVLSEGPGSYTGLRIGTSTAKGLCYGMDIPLLVVPTLEIIAAAAFDFLPSKRPLALYPMIDARRMEVYTSRMVLNYTLETAPVEARIITEESSLEEDMEVYYFGDGAAKCQKYLEQNRVHLLRDIIPDARYICKLINMKQISGQNIKKIDGKDLAYFEPFYLKEFVAAPSHIKGLN